LTSGGVLLDSPLTPLCDLLWCFPLAVETLYKLIRADPPPFRRSNELTFKGVSYKSSLVFTCDRYRLLA